MPLVPPSRSSCVPVCVARLCTQSSRTRGRRARRRGCSAGPMGMFSLQVFECNGLLHGPSEDSPSWATTVSRRGSSRLKPSTKRTAALCSRSFLPGPNPQTVNWSSPLPNCNCADRAPPRSCRTSTWSSRCCVAESNLSRDRNLMVKTARQQAGKSAGLKTHGLTGSATLLSYLRKVAARPGLTDAG